MIFVGLCQTILVRCRPFNYLILEIVGLKPELSFTSLYLGNIPAEVMNTFCRSQCLRVKYLLQNADFPFTHIVALLANIINAIWTMGKLIFMLHLQGE